jgi:hypothetical protein
MAGAGAKLFVNGQKLFAADVNEYLMDQTVMRFADATARDAAFGGVGEPILAEGMMCYLMDVNVLQVYDGSSWKYVANADTPTGLVKITPSSVSGTGATITSSGSVNVSGGTTSGIIINDCFVDEFVNYRIIMNNGTMSSGGFVQMRLTSGGVENSTASSYRRNGTTITSSVLYSAETASYYYIGVFNATSSHSASCDMCNPKLPQSTFWMWHTVESNVDTSYWGGRHNQSVAYDGLKFFSNTGTFNTTISIYGYL